MKEAFDGIPLFLHLIRLHWHIHVRLVPRVSFLPSRNDFWTRENWFLMHERDGEIIADGKHACCHYCRCSDCGTRYGRLFEYFRVILSSIVLQLVREVIEAALRRDGDGYDREDRETEVSPSIVAGQIRSKHTGIIQAEIQRWREVRETQRIESRGWKKNVIRTQPNTSGKKTQN